MDKLFIENKFKENNLFLTETQLSKLDLFFKKFQIHSKIINLTSIQDDEEILVKHFLDSAILLNFFSKEIFINKKVIDLGVGGGFPGIILAIMLEKTDFTFVDSTQKKINFLNEIIKELDLKNAKAICTRAEKINDTSFDFVISRAFAPLSINLEISSYLISKKGKIILYKTPEEHQKAIEKQKIIFKKLDLKFIKGFDFKLNNQFERSFLFFEKQRNSSNNIIREFNKIKKNPIF